MVFAESKNHPPVEYEKPSESLNNSVSENRLDHLIVLARHLEEQKFTEEAIEDNLYDRLGARYTKALARSMAHTKQVKAAAVLNNAFSSSFTGGDGVSLVNTSHPLAGGGTFSNRPSTYTDLN